MCDYTVVVVVYKDGVQRTVANVCVYKRTFSFSSRTTDRATTGFRAIANGLKSVTCTRATAVLEICPAAWTKEKREQRYFFFFDPARCRFRTAIESSSIRSE